MDFKTLGVTGVLGGVKPLHLDAVFTSCLPFIVEFINIINMENLNIINFYLVYNRYLLSFGVAACAWECAWRSEMHVTRRTLKACGLKKLVHWEAGGKTL